MKVQWDVDGGRILLGDNTDGVTVMLRPFNSTPLCVCVCVCVLCIFTVDHMHTQFRLAPDLPECNYCVTQGVPVTSSFYILQKCNSQVSFHASHQQLQAPVASAANTSEILVLAILLPMTGRMGSTSLTCLPVAQMTWQPLRSYNMDTDTDTPTHTARRGRKHICSSFLGVFAKLQKTTISFVMFVCLSVSPHGTTRLPLDGFWRNFLFEPFSKICREIQVP